MEQCLCDTMVWQTIQSRILVEQCVARNMSRHFAEATIGWIHKDLCCGSMFSSMDEGFNWIVILSDLHLKIKQNWEDPCPRSTLLHHSDTTKH